MLLVHIRVDATGRLGKRTLKRRPFGLEEGMHPHHDHSVGPRAASRPIAAALLLGVRVRGAVLRLGLDAMYAP